MGGVRRRRARARHPGALPEPPQHARAARRRHADRERREGRGPAGGRVRRAGSREAPARRSPKPTSRSSTNRTRSARRAARSISCAARSSRSSKQRRSQQARAMLVEELKAKDGANVKVMLDPPRYTVPIGEHDPVRGESDGAGDASSSSPTTSARSARASIRRSRRSARPTAIKRQDRVQGFSAAEPRRRRRRRPRRRTAPASRASTGRCTTRCSRTSARSRCRRSSRRRARIGLDGDDVRSVPGFRQARGERFAPAASSASRWA